MLTRKPKKKQQNNAVAKHKGPGRRPRYTVQSNRRGDEQSRLCELFRLLHQQGHRRRERPRYTEAERKASLYEYCETHHIQVSNVPVDVDAILFFIETFLIHYNPPQS